MLINAKVTSGSTWPIPLEIEVSVFGPASAPTPVPADLPTRDPLWDLPLETLVDPGDVKAVRKQILERVKADYQLVDPGYIKPFQVKLSSVKKIRRDQPLYLRIKFNAADKTPSGVYGGLWRVGVPRKTQLWESEMMSLAPDTFHEFPVPPYFDDDGVLTVGFLNPNNTPLLFPLDDGFEVLYVKAPGQIDVDLDSLLGGPSKS